LIGELRGRRSELERSVLARVYGVADPSEAADPEYITGLKAAVSAAIGYGYSAIEASSGQLAPVPPVVLVQARLAARNRISLDTVLRRYHGGNTLFSQMLIEEAERCELPRSELKCVFRSLASAFDRLLEAVSEEHRREGEAQAEKGGRRRVALIERLLAGEPLDSGELGYELEGHHLALVISGLGAAEAIGALGEKFDRLVLLASPHEETVWCWLGGQRKFEESELELLEAFEWPERVGVGCGEPGQGLAGWRLSHRQAGAALPVAKRSGSGIVRYGDVSLLASALQDELLATSLRELYLAPLAEERNEGMKAKETLRAYFAAARNASSAAAALGVSRRTIASRLAAIEERLGRSVGDASAELETVLRLDEIE
jgi:hypothetical protein